MVPLSCCSALSPPSALPLPSFHYDRSSPAVRWPSLPHLDEQEKEELSHADGQDAASTTLQPCDPPAIIPSPVSLNPYIAAKGQRRRVAGSTLPAAGLWHENDATSGRRLLARRKKLSKLALRRAKDWRERAERLAGAICRLETSQSIGDLLNAWKEQLAPADMSYVVKTVGTARWQRALELYEWLNLRRWYSPNSRMLATILGVLGRANQVSVAEEIFGRAEPNVGNCVQVYNAIMSVYARQGDCNRVQHLFGLMSSRGCDPDLFTYNIVINARSKLGLPAGMAKSLLQQIIAAGLTPDVVTYNTLISACASASNCSEAAELFRDMNCRNCEPDIWTYNALISVFGRSGEVESAKELFQTMQKKGFVPDAVTFNSILYAFARYGNVDDADKVRNQMNIAGCKADEITYNTMISMYGKLGLRDKALCLYREMKSDGCHPDTVTFTVLIDVLGKAGLVAEAEHIFSEMGDAEVRPSLQAFSAMICSYSKAGMLVEAEKTYDCMLRTGIRPDYLAYSVMVEVFLKANLPKKAMSVYQNMAELGLRLELDTYESLLRMLVREKMEDELAKLSLDLQESKFDHAGVSGIFLKAGMHDKAAEFLIQVAADGHIPSYQASTDVLSGFSALGRYSDARLFVKSLSSFSRQAGSLIHQTLIRLLAEAKQYDAAMEELNEFKGNDQVPKMETYRALLVAFKQAEMLDEVVQLLSDMKCSGVQLDVECCRVAATTYCEQGLLGSARDLLSSMKFSKLPKGFLEVYVALIEAYGKQQDWENAECIFKELQKLGCNTSMRVWNALISTYAVCGRYGDAKLALYEMVNAGCPPTTDTCNMILEALINTGHLNDIHALLVELRQLGACPSKYIFLFALNVSAKKGNAQEAKVVYQEMKYAGYLPNMQVYKNLILLLSKAGFVRDCELILREMEFDNFVPDLDIYNAMLKLYSKVGCYDKAVGVFQRMEAMSCSPDSDTFNSLIWLYSRHLKIQEALALLRQMGKAGCSPNIKSYTALISACRRLRLVEAAEILFKDMIETGSQPNLSVFHAMMKVYNSVGKHEQAKELLNCMKASGIEPTVGTFHALMDTYGKGGEPGGAEAVFEHLQENGIIPGVLQFTGLINAYLKNREYDLAIQKLFKMKTEGFEPNYTTWTCFVSAASLCEKRSQAMKLLLALRDAGFSLPWRLLMEKNDRLFIELKDVLVDLETFGQDAGVGLTNVLMDLLWGFQCRATAARIFETAIQENVYQRNLARVQANDWGADFRRLSAGGALVALTLWLHQMQDAALKGIPESSKSVSIVTGGSQNAHRVSINRTIKAHLWSMGSPFLPSKTRTGVLLSKGHSLRMWLKDSPHCMNLELRDFPVLPETNSMQVHNGGWICVELIPALQQIEERLGEVRPKKFSRLIHMSDVKRMDSITSDIQGRQEMLKKGKTTLKKSRRVGFKMGR